MIFSVTYYLNVHNAISLTIDVIFYKVKLLVFYNIKTINLTFFDEI